ncbi:hypothetical protein ACDL59_09370 [Corynebacterium diphtheriae]|uniref:hypothetical protein n=1 Tax=Corynebacterium diphtheriae TaxID=1717 RepID=UPI0013CA2EEA|nr:hypothetical protein FRC0076_01755 [Corynebacterium diphtheriae]CAB0706415.1 hypothetical protein FRC0077_01765 [Corynebacterium diphtheriae]CAB0734903.1 hypothetical protein FRC0088_01812 [Corynebacterium diphtheriae]
MTVVIILVTRWYQQLSDRIVLRQKGERVSVDNELVAWLEEGGIAKRVTEEEPTEDHTDAHASEDHEATGQDDERESEDHEATGQDDERETEPEAPARPLNAANRATWDAYARARGVDPAQYKNKDELIAALP